MAEPPRTRRPRATARVSQEDAPEEEKESPARDNALAATVLVTHVSVDVGMRNLGVFCVLVDPVTLVWVDVLLLATFDVCSGVASGGKKCTSGVISNVVELLDALTVIHSPSRCAAIFVEEQFVARVANQMNLEARHVEFALLGYVTARRRAWSPRHELAVYRVPSALKLRGCPQELRRNKPRYKEWARLSAVELLRERGFELAASVVESSKKGDDAGDAVKQYVEAIDVVRGDASKYAW